MKKLFIILLTAIMISGCATRHRSYSYDIRVRPMTNSQVSVDRNWNRYLYNQRMKRRFRYSNNLTRDLFGNRVFVNRIDIFK
jgi:hypothetical protein